MKFNITYLATITPTTILKEHLDRCDVDYKMTGIGEVEIENKLSEENYQALQKSLRKYSIEILSDEKSQLVQRVKNVLIELAYDDKPQLMTLSGFLSKKLGFSYGYISYVFTSKTLTSIENYLIMLRIERAKKLIIEDVLSLKEISYALNYSSIGHFSRQFKKTTGITISIFKKVISNRRSRPLSTNYQ